MGSLFILRCFLLFFFLFLCQGAFAAAGKIWSRTEMVEMAGYGEQKLSSVIIAGSLLCDTWRPHLPSIAIPGATVAIKCHTGYKRRSKWIKAVTDDLGEFEIDLPSQLHAIPDMENTCVVKPVHVPKLYRCNHRSTNTHKRIKLVSSTNGFRVYTSGKIKLQGHSSRS
ncbi:uncharacterized protein LOC106409203 isoform X1 [Brassica napus]|uniref:uncharacterized protein LOC106409203 isoform X1 n=1 Tax=Brassica napus TaxID=3708 RepID=UPI0006AAE5EF|nr:uncharacterized protein LOC106409203 isoform X1 [Brassica napus]